MTGCLIGATREEALERAHEPSTGARPAMWGSTTGSPATRSALVGSVDEVAARLREYEQAGCERVMLQHLLHTDLEPVRLIGPPRRVIRPPPRASRQEPSRSATACSRSPRRCSCSSSAPAACSSASVPDSTVRAISRAFNPGVPMYGIVLLVAVFSPLASVFLTFAIAAFYLPSGALFAER